MASSHSWKWLPTRSSVRSAFAPSSSGPPGRPCLAEIEQLDDRILLSAAPDASIVTEGGGADQVLVALLRGQLPIVGDELAALKIAGDLVTSGAANKVDYIKFSNELLKVNDLLYGLGGDLIQSAKTNVSDISITKRIDKSTPVLFNELQQVDTLASILASKVQESALLPAVQQLDTDVGSLTGGLLKVAPSPDTISEEVSLNFTKIAVEYKALDEDIVKIGTDVAIGNKVTPGEQKYLEITLKDVVVSSYKLSDPSLQQLVTSLANETAALSPGGGGGVIG